MADKVKREGNTKTVYFYRYDDSIEGIRKTIENSPFISEVFKTQLTLFVKGFTFISVPVLNEAPLAREFYNGDKEIQVVIFSHSIGKDRMSYTGILAELASYGFLVIALNHNDQSCTHTVGHEQEVEEQHAPDTVIGPQTIQTTLVKKRQPIEFDTAHDYDDMEFRRLQL